MKEYIFNFYKSGEVRFVKSIRANSEIEARAVAIDLFMKLMCYDEVAMSI